MKLFIRACALVIVVSLLHFGNACSRPFSSNENFHTFGLFTCVSDESTLANLSPMDIKEGYLGNRKVRYRNQGNGYLLVDGDILLESEHDLPEEPNPHFVSRGVGIAMGSGKLWPGGILPYQISSQLPNPQRVLDAINHWNTNLQGVIQLVPRTAQNDYVYFTPVSSGCAATVGYSAGRGAHPVQLGTECGSGNVAHEIGHIVGLDHEQNRLDRDNFVTINYGSILAGFDGNFQVNPSSQNYEQYDFGSIMHYGLYAFSRDGSRTILPRVVVPPNIFIGQRQGLSIGDINSVRVMYGSAPIPGSGGIDPGTQPPPPAPPTLTVQNGLLVRYFADDHFGDMKLQRIEQKTAFDWGSQAPIPELTNGTFSVRLTGYIMPPQSGDYSFQLKTNDNARVMLSEESQIFEVTGENRPKESVSINYSLQTGYRYILIMDMWKNQIGPASISLSWRRPDGVLEPIPVGNVIPDANDSIRAPCQPHW